MDGLKNLREKHGFSQTYVASILGVSRQMYIKYENGLVEPSLYAVRELRKLYGVTYEDILDGSKPLYCTAEEAPVYCVTRSREKILLHKIQTAVHIMSREKLETVLAFVSFLNSNVPGKKLKSKKAFFDLIGKVNLDADSVSDFRMASMI